MKKVLENILLGAWLFLPCMPTLGADLPDPLREQRPNVVLVVTDDQGYGDMSCHGNPFLVTPNIDRLYRESVRLTDFHVDPTCAPTRAALLSGKYSSKVGVWHTLAGRSIMDRDEVTLADIFKENGYRTALFGKWHLGDNYPYRPQDRGYEEVLTFGGGGVGQNGDYWRNDYFDDVYVHNGKNKLYEGYCTDVWFSNAIRFIEENKSKSFFCEIATNAPHFEYFVPDRYTTEFRKQGMDDHSARYAGMIANIDENLGKLLKKLEDLSLAKNTIFIFMSDNGRSGVGLPKEGPFFYNAGMRGVKGSSYDGGHRAPCFVRWPQKGILGPRDIDQLTAHFDWMPTLIEWCHLTSRRRIGFDGKSIAGLLEDPHTAWEERTLFVHNQRIDIPVKWRNCAVLTEQYRLVNGKELYDIREDPGQKRNIASEYPGIVKDLRVRYEQWWKDISVKFDQYSRFYLGDTQENPTRLVCLDWHTEDQARIWDQEVVRQRLHKNGIWAVEIVRDGLYEFICRTYPKEEDTRLRVARVRVKIGDQEVEKDCDPGMPEVKVAMELKAGRAMLQTWFYEADGKSYGVPFVYITRL